MKSLPLNIKLCIFRKNFSLNYLAAPQVLAMAHDLIFVVAWNLWRYMGDLVRGQDWTWVPCIGGGVSSHWPPLGVIQIELLNVFDLNSWDLGGGEGWLFEPHWDAAVFFFFLIQWRFLFESRMVCLETSRWIIIQVTRPLISEPRFWSSSLEIKTYPRLPENEQWP